MNEFITNPLFRVLGVVLLVAGLSLMGSSLYQSWKYDDRDPRIDHLTEVIASLYPIGLGFKVLLFGPEFLRFHLTDIGFPVSIGLLMYGMYRSGLAKNVYFSELDPIRRQRLLIRLRCYFMVLGLLLSYGYETTVGIIYRLNPGKTPMFIGDFDWSDMGMYTLGGLAGLALLVWRHRALERDIANYEMAAAATRQTLQQLTKITNQKLRRQYAPRQKKRNR